MESFIVPALAGIGIYLLVSRRARASAAVPESAHTATVDTQAGSSSTPVSSFQPGGFISTTAPLTAVGLGHQTSSVMGSGGYSLLEVGGLYNVPVPSAQISQAPGGSPVLPAANPAAIAPRTASTGGLMRRPMPVM